MLLLSRAPCVSRATAKPGGSRNRSSGPAVPLSRIQTDILRLLAAHRDPESYVARASPLNRNAPRISDDIDVFHDREERVANAALNDAHALTAAGHAVSWLRQLPLMYTAEVTQGDAGTRLEWVADSDYRCFPTMQDETFGYVLHPVDLAMNKVMPAAGRRELRDNANYPAADWRALQSSEPLDAKDIMARLRAALDQAEAFIVRMPTDKLGLLFLEAGEVVQPDPDRLDAYQTHAGQRRGQWPSSPEISAAMFERHNKKPNR
jgi:hypothetical protein